MVKFREKNLNKFFLLDEILAYGHENVLSTHKTTIEITKDSELTRKGDCIIAVKANKSCYELSVPLKNYLKQSKPVKIVIEVNGIKDEIVAFGSPKLKLIDKNAIVIRKSDFIDDRTVAIGANKSAVELSRELIKQLKNSKNIVRVKFVF